MSNKKQFFQKYKAFTLAELIVTIAIILIITAISWATLNSSSKNSEVNSVCNQLAAKINKARNYALTGKMGYSAPDTPKIPTYSVARIRDKSDTSSVSRINVFGYTTSVNYKYCSDYSDCELTEFIRNPDISTKSTGGAIRINLCYKIPNGELYIADTTDICENGYALTTPYTLEIKDNSSATNPVTKTLTITPSAATCQ